MGDLFRQIGDVPCIIKRYVWDGQTILEVEIYERHKGSQIYAAKVNGDGYVALLMSNRVLRNEITKMVGDFVIPLHPKNTLSHYLSLAFSKKDGK